MKYLLVLCLLALANHAAFAHGPIENRIALRSEAVIRNDLRQLGMQPQTITMNKDKATVKATLDGNPVVLELDRIGDGVKFVSGNATVKSFLKNKLPRSLKIGRAVLLKPITPMKTVPVAPAIRRPVLN
jgi:hypothetical protein